MNKQRGIALVLVLWILSLLTLMAGGFMLTVRRETAIVSGLKNSAAAMATAESGLAIAEWMLLNPDVNKRWRADGSIYQINMANAKLRIQLLAETGKININYAEFNLLQNLFNQAPNGAEAQIGSMTINRAAAIMDWRDNDDLAHNNGAEKKQYHEAGLNYQPRNQLFQSLEELQMVLGMDEKTLKWLEPLITVYTLQPQVDIQQASKDVLQVLPGADSNAIENYVLARVESAKANLPPPPPPANFVADAGGGEITLVNIISEVRYDDQSTAMINALVKKSDTPQTAPFQIVHWQRSVANNLSLFSESMNQLVVKRYAGFEFNH